jgi:DNA invertase Pin-like site-specific DNA recombinase
MAAQRVALYTRVSTASQSTENQRHELLRVAQARNWEVIAEYADDGISGAKGRSQRPALDALLKDAVRGKFSLIAVWSIDRLGRSLQHLIEIANELKSVGVDLYVHQQALDTSSSSGKLAFSVFGAERAKRNGTKLGRPTNLNAAVRSAIVALRARDVSIRQIASQLKVGTGTIYKVLQAA